MSRGLTIADLVQQVLYAMYKVRLDVDASKEGAFHSKSDKFKEIVMETNFVLQELQKEQDWNFLRERWDIGPAHNPHDGHMQQEFTIPEGIYKLCTGYNDGIRLHCRGGSVTIPITSPRSGNRFVYDMHDDRGRLNVMNVDQKALVVGDILTFLRRWNRHEIGGFLETDVVRYIEPLHICDDDCPDNCPLAYDEVLFKWFPDPYYIVVKTAAKRALADPSCADLVQPLTDEATKFLSSIRENDSAHTDTDTYETGTIGYLSVY